MGKRVVYFDVLNILACFCVICLHCNGIVHTYTQTSAWAQSLAVEVICYWAVPIFFMLTGATLMNYRSKYDTKTFFGHRIKRTVIPFLFFSVFMYILYVYEFKTLKPITSVRAFADAVFNCKILPVYWFFIPLFAVYLALPVLSRLLENRKTLWYLFWTAFTTVSLLPFLCSVLKIRYNMAFSLPVAAGYVIYVILGYLLSTCELSRRTRGLVYIGGLLAVLGRYLGTFFLSKRDGTLNQLFFGYTSIFGVGLAAAVFIFFKQLPFDRLAQKLEEKGIPATRWTAFISSCSFGIYLIHIAVMSMVQKQHSVNISGWKWRLLGPVLVYVICLVIIGVLKKIPGVKRLIP